MLRLLRVAGNSLAPTYQDGDYVLALSPILVRAYRAGDIIVFRHHSYGTMIKQIEHVSPAGDEIYVVGTNEHSVDSRRFGPISKKDVIGKVVWHIKK